MDKSSSSQERLHGHEAKSYRPDGSLESYSRENADGSIEYHLYHADGSREQSFLKRIDGSWEQTDYHADGSKTVAVYLAKANQYLCQLWTFDGWLKHEEIVDNAARKIV